MGKPAARLGDPTMHGGTIIIGFPTVLIGGKPAARIGDMHVCPMVTPGTPPIPHVGGPITMGAPTVLIGNMPAACMGDMATCIGPPDTIMMGCPTVLIGMAGGGGAGAAGAAAGAAAANFAVKTKRRGGLFGAIVGGIAGEILDAVMGAAIGGLPGAIIGGIVGAMKGGAAAIEAWLIKDDNARKEISALTDDKIKKIPIKEKIRLAEDLTGGYVSGDDQKALKKLYGSLEQKDYQPPSDENKTKKFQIAIKNDKDIQDAKSKWTTLNDENREKTLQKVADHHSDAYDLPKKDLKFKDLGDMGSYGYYSSFKDAVVVSNHKDPSIGGRKILDDVDEAFDTVAHENTHRYQKDVVKKLNKGEIPKSDDRYDQARLMRANDKCYFKPDEENEKDRSYVQQPKEAHAWKVGNAAKNP